MAYKDGELIGFNCGLLGGIKCDKSIVESLISNGIRENRMAVSSSNKFQREMDIFQEAFKAKDFLFVISMNKSMISFLEAIGLTPGFLLRESTTY